MISIVEIRIPLPHKITNFSFIRTRQKVYPPYMEIPLPTPPDPPSERPPSAKFYQQTCLSVNRAKMTAIKMIKIIHSVKKNLSKKRKARVLFLVLESITQITQDTRRGWTILVIYF
jgi:hypothetical protein